MALFASLAIAATAVFHGSMILFDLDFSLSLSSPSLYLYLAGIAMPSIVGIALVERGSRLGFLRSRLGVNAPLRTYAYAIGAQAGLIGVAWASAYLFGTQPPTELVLGSGFAVLALGQIWVVLGEEVGWRGFALPKLIALFGHRRATLMLAVLWGAWHAPMFFVAKSLQQGASPWLFASSIYAWSAIHSILYTRCQPSIVPNLVFHACANLTLNLGLLSTQLEPYLIGVYLCVGTCMLFLLPRRG